MRFSSARRSDRKTSEPALSRRRLLQAAAGAALGSPAVSSAGAAPPRKALVVISMDLEMSRHYPRRGMREWDYAKGLLDAATIRYAVEAAQRVKEHGGVIHFFALGRTMELPQVEWLRRLAQAGHPVGNHTYDHVNLKARSVPELQYRFRRAPWLVAGQSVSQIIRRNIQMTNEALRTRCGIRVRGFRTPGGFSDGLRDRPDLQKMLLELGFRWVSSLYPRHPLGPPGQRPTEHVLQAVVAALAQGQPFVYPSGLVELPMSPPSDVVAMRSGRWPLEAFLECLRRCLEWTITHGAVFDFLCHPSCLVVEDPKFQAIELICRMVKRRADRARLVDLDTVAQTVHIPERMSD